MAKTGIYQQIDTLMGVQPPSDKTESNTRHFTAADKIRFENGVPKKIKGWSSILFDYDLQIDGCARTVFTEVIDGVFYTIIGTHKKLYAVLGSTLTNITPLSTTDISVPDSIDTHYDTLANNPLGATNGSQEIVVQDADSADYMVNDTITLSGASGFAGILAGQLNGPHLIRSIGVGNYTINVGVTANATTSGGGAAVVRSSGLITINDAAHGQENGDRVKVDDAATTGGILDTEINQEFIIRNVAAGSFDVMTDGTSTSAVSAGGGAGTIYYPEIPDGNLNQGASVGYGAGLFGAGLYGTALTSTSAITYPRIWYCDRFGNSIVMTPGNGTGVYQWFGDLGVAPALVSGAPTRVNYLFVSDNILVTLGAYDGSDPQVNRVFASDQNDITQWTSSSVNQVFDDDVEGAGRLIGHVPVEDYNILYTENKCYTFRYIGLPFIWEIKELDPNIGAASSISMINTKSVAVWQGQTNFYMFRGGIVEVIPANSQEESTCLNYVFDNTNYGQKSKCYTWYNVENQEAWFHYPSGSSNEPDLCVVVDMLDFTWATHTFDRVGAERPGVKMKNPRMTRYDPDTDISYLYQHEVGNDADGEPLTFTLTTNKRYYGRDNINLNAIIPDSITEHNLNLHVDGWLFPQSPAPILSEDYTITPTTDRIQILGSARYHQYTVTGEELGQEWIGGEWLEEIQKGPTE